MRESLKSIFLTILSTEGDSSRKLFTYCWYWLLY